MLLKLKKASHAIVTTAKASSRATKGKQLHFDFTSEHGQFKPRRLLYGSMRLRQFLPKECSSYGSCGNPPS